MSSHISNFFFTIFIVILIIIFFAGCEPYQAITFDNKTSFQIKVDTIPVPSDYSGDISSMYREGAVVERGQSKKYLTSVSNTRPTDTKYAVVAVNEVNRVIFSKVFTWDELHDMGWRVVISQRENSLGSSNTTIAE